MGPRQECALHSHSRAGHGTNASLE